MVVDHFEFDLSGCVDCLNSWARYDYYGTAMRKTAIVMLIVSLGVLGLLLYSQTAALREQRRKVQELNTKLEAMSNTTSLDLQEKCAKQARERFTFEGFEKRAMANFLSHYNTKLNKCFVQMASTDAKKPPISTYMMVSDAFEGKVYAEYMKNWNEVSPFVCKVTLLSGEERFCHSDDEFHALVKQYME
jgi:hypothetical protein